MDCLLTLGLGQWTSLNEYNIITQRLYFVLSPYQVDLTLRGCSIPFHPFATTTLMPVPSGSISVDTLFPPILVIVKVSSKLIRDFLPMFRRLFELFPLSASRFCIPMTIEVHVRLVAIIVSAAMISFLTPPPDSVSTVSCQKYNVRGPTLTEPEIGIGRSQFTVDT